MARKIKLEFTEFQMSSLLEMIGSIEVMQGCSEPLEDDDGEPIPGTDWDVEMEKCIKALDRMFKSNGYSR